MALCGKSARARSPPRLRPAGSLLALARLPPLGGQPPALALALATEPSPFLARALSPPLWGVACGAKPRPRVCAPGPLPQDPSGGGVGGSGLGAGRRGAGAAGAGHQELRPSHPAAGSTARALARCPSPPPAASAPPRPQSPSSHNTENTSRNLQCPLRALIHSQRLCPSPPPRIAELLAHSRHSINAHRALSGNCQNVGEV